MNIAGIKFQENNKRTINRRVHLKTLAILLMRPVLERKLQKCFNDEDHKTIRKLLRLPQQVEVSEVTA